MNNLSCFPSVDEPPDMASLRHLAYAIIFPIILGIGFLFNTFSLYATARSALNSVALSYLLAMILSNLVLMFLAVPWLIYRSSEPTECYFYSNAFYHAYLELPLLNWMATYSTYVLLCMSVERYVSVNHLALFKRIHLLPRARAALLVTLLFTFLIHVPMYLKLSAENCNDCWTIVPNNQETSTTLWRAYIWMAQILARFIPCGALIILNISTMIKYRKIIKKRSRMTTDAVSNSYNCTPNSSLNNLSLSVKPKKPNLNASSQDEKRQLKLLSGLVCLVAICIVPTGVAALLPPGSGPHFYIFWVVVEGLELFHHALVSFVICLCNNEIHRRLGKIITCNSDSV